MKKKVAFLLALVMAFALAGSALASDNEHMVTMRYTFHITTSSTSEYQVGCSGIEKTENRWYIILDESRSNLSPTHRAVTRVHDGYNAASATWVYSGPSRNEHPYNADCQGVKNNLSYRGRLDDRDSGVLEFHGTFVTFFNAHG